MSKAIHINTLRHALKCAAIGVVGVNSDAVLALFSVSEVVDGEVQVALNAPAEGPLREAAMQVLEGLQTELECLGVEVAAHA